MKTTRITMTSTPEMVDLVNSIILSDKRITKEEISKQKGFSLDTVHKILHDDCLF